MRFIQHWLQLCDIDLLSTQLYRVRHACKHTNILLYRKV